MSTRHFAVCMLTVVVGYLIPVTTAAVDLSGIVTDCDTDRPIPDVTVRLEPSERATRSEADGRFVFSRLDSGEYLLRITHVGYAPFETVINLNSDSREIAIHLEPRAIRVEPMIVTDRHAHSRLEAMAHHQGHIEGRELQKQLGLSLAATLKDEAGVAMRSMGPAPARPVIRGMGGDRVLLAEDGEKTSDLSATSPDHAVTIEPFALERVEVIRGPRVLLYTPTTIGGVVNAIRHEIPIALRPAWGGVLGAYGESANDGYLGSAILDVPVGSLAMRGEVSRRDASDVRTPVGTLGNSDALSLDYAVGGSIVKSWGVIGGSYRRFALDYGVPGGFIGAHPDGVDIEMKRKQHSALARFELGDGAMHRLDIRLSRTYYRHTEYEARDLIGSEFEIVDYKGRAELELGRLGPFSAGIGGLSVEYRDFDIGGYVFTEPTKSLNVSVFGVQEINAGRFGLEFGARVSYDQITPEQEDPDSDIGFVRERTFATYSLSTSVLYAVSESWSLGANLSRSSRVPTIEELYSQGPHLAAYSYETGNPDLDSERGVGSELFVYHRGKAVTATANVFYNALDSYIIPYNTGDTNYQTFLPIYATDGVRARLYGVEADVDWRIGHGFKANGKVSATWGRFAGGGGPLPQIPPLKASVDVRYRTGSFTFGAQVRGAWRQDEVAEFEEPTAGYAITGFTVEYAAPLGRRVHSLTLSLDNALDREYRNHLSRVKSILPEAGRNLRLSYKLFL